MPKPMPPSIAAGTTSGGKPSDNADAAPVDAVDVVGSPVAVKSEYATTEPD